MNDYFLCIGQILENEAHRLTIETLDCEKLLIILEARAALSVEENE